MNVVYHAGVLVAAEQGDRAVWADHRIRLEVGTVPTTTAPVVAQVSRSTRQVQLRRFLRGCEIGPFRPEQSQGVGALLSKAGTSDVVDAHLVLSAAAGTATVLTSDLDDLRRLASFRPTPVSVRRV